MIEKLKMQTADGVNENIQKIAELFPECVTEVNTASASAPAYAHKIDFDKLKELLSHEIIDDSQERYQFTWPDKRKAIHLANETITKTLRPCREESVDFDNTKNLYIEGDNLDVLKCLKETYRGRIKMIYIDPPYNTGNDFIYDDDFSQSDAEYEESSGQYNTEGNRLVANPESNGRFHTDWLNMIYPRLKLARDLLSDDGVIFISIDDHELYNLQTICNEIFGNQNFVSMFIWNCSTAGGIRPKFVSKTHEYILSYAKNKMILTQWSAPLSNDAKSCYKQINEKGPYRDKDFIFKNKSNNINQKYDITCPDGEIVHPKAGYIYRFIEKTFLQALNDGDVSFKRSTSSPLLNQDGEQAHWNIYIKKYLGEGLGTPSSVIPKDLVGLYNNGTELVQGLFDGVRVFENVKPIELVMYFQKIITAHDDLILDFFSGSGTSAHAVMKLNAEDGQNRKYILVQIDQNCDVKSEAFLSGYKNICEIGKERIRRAGKKIKEESPLTTQNLDIGFRVLKLSDSNMKDVYYSPDETKQSDLFSLVDNIKEDRTPEDLLFQEMLDLGISLDSKIVVDEIQGQKVFKVDDNALIACFDDQVNEATVQAIADCKPLHAVFRDVCFADDNTATNAEQIFKSRELDPKKVLRII